MNRKRLGQALIGGVFTACAAVITALAELAASESKKRQAAADAKKRQAAAKEEGRGERAAEIKENEKPHSAGAQGGTP